MRSTLSVYDKFLVLIRCNVVKAVLLGSFATYISARYCNMLTEYLLISAKVCGKGYCKLSFNEDRAETYITGLM